MIPQPPARLQLATLILASCLVGAESGAEGTKGLAPHHNRIFHRSRRNPLRVGVDRLPCLSFILVSPLALEEWCDVRMSRVVAQVPQHDIMHAKESTVFSQLCRYCCNSITAVVAAPVGGWLHLTGRRHVVSHFVLALRALASGHSLQVTPKSARRHPRRL